jgi:hypothetical protein
MVLPGCWLAFALAREEYLSSELARSYSLQRVRQSDVPLVAALHGRELRVTEDRGGKVLIAVDGRPVAEVDDAAIDPNQNDYRRYPRIATFQITDLLTNSTMLVIVARLNDADAEALRYRTVTLSEDGTSSVAEFAFRDRAEPLYRRDLASAVTPFQIGFKTSIHLRLPSLFSELALILGCTLAGVLILAMRFMSAK